MQESRITDVLLTEHVQSSLLFTAGPSKGTSCLCQGQSSCSLAVMEPAWVRKKRKKKKKEKEDKIYLKRGTEGSISDSGGSRSCSNVKVELW